VSLLPASDPATNKRYAILWSGGKDSCLSLWHARKLGLVVTSLVNFFDEATSRVRFHATRTELIAQQAAALGLDLIQRPTSSDNYSAVVSDTLRMLKEHDYAGLVAGDIHLEDVREGNEVNAARAGLRLVEPLWHGNGVALLEDFVASGFRAVLTCCDERWPDILRPGREIDRAFIEDVSAATAIDPSGEYGEYHSFVFDGPLFMGRVGWQAGAIRRSNGFAQLDLVPGVAIPSPNLA
jgi:diphthine-ammonia ligase